MQHGPMNPHQPPTAHLQQSYIDPRFYSTHILFNFFQILPLITHQEQFTEAD